MACINDIVRFCDNRLDITKVPDFSGSCNGLQLQNNQSVFKIGSSVDAGIEPFRKAIAKGVDFLIVHHGLFWTPPVPLTGTNYLKIKLCLDNNLAVYASHLPLDCHSEIGNNFILASKIGLKPYGSFLPFEGNDIGLLASNTLTRKELNSKLRQIFPKGITSMEFGSEKPDKIAILTGSGQSAVEKVQDSGSDTLVTGELKQQHFNIAQELGLNLYACGHYATETFGVQALGLEVAEKFKLAYEFIDTDCPL